MPPTARERVRAELSREIKEEARRQLAASGADGLSLRAVARELGMVSSALYRYYPSRDDLLTALIIDAYNALGAAAEGAIAAGQAGPARDRWTAACHAIRDWALANPHEYALIYGRPCPATAHRRRPSGRRPGYRSRSSASSRARSPRGEIGGGRAGGTGRPAGHRPARRAGGRALAAQADALSGRARAVRSRGPAAALPPDVLVRAVIAWTQLFGMISFELFGQFVGSFEPADALFGHAARQLAAFVGLR